METDFGRIIVSMISLVWGGAWLYPRVAFDTMLKAKHSPSAGECYFHVCHSWMGDCHVYFYSVSAFQNRPRIVVLEDRVIFGGTACVEWCHSEVEET